MSHPFVNIHTHNNRRNDEISVFSLSLGESESHVVPSAPYSAGVHPWAVGKVNLAEALGCLEHLDIVAIGEIGLDFSVKEADRDLQIAVFKAQLDIAAQRELPVVIHCVRALDQILAILRNYRLKAVIFHSFIGSSQQAKAVIDQNYYISLSGRSFDSPKTVAAIKHAPLDRLFLETDAAHVDIKHIYDIAAVEMGADAELLEKTIYNNYKTIFE